MFFTLSLRSSWGLLPGGGLPVDLVGAGSWSRAHPLDVPPCRNSIWWLSPSRLLSASPHVLRERRCKNNAAGSGFWKIELILSDMNANDTWWHIVAQMPKVVKKGVFGAENQKIGQGEVAALKIFQKSYWKPFTSLAGRGCATRRNIFFWTRITRIARIIFSCLYSRMVAHDLRIVRISFWVAALKIFRKIIYLTTVFRDI